MLVTNSSEIGPLSDKADKNRHDDLQESAFVVVKFFVCRLHNSWLEYVHASFTLSESL